MKEDILELMQKSCKGVYQRGLIAGKYKWDGSDLQGKAKEWKNKYYKSSRNLRIRINTKLGQYYPHISMSTLGGNLLLYYKGHPCTQI